MNNPATLDTLTITETWQSLFETEQARQGHCPATISAYRQDLRAWASWFELANDTPFTPEQINNWDLQAYRTWCLETARVSPATWNRRRASLSAFCAWLRAEGVVTYAVMDGIGGYEQVEQAPRWLTKAEFGRVMRQLELMVHAANTPDRARRALRDGALVAVMAYAGLREGEACALLVRDVELGERRGRIWVRLGKGQVSREVPAAPELRRWLAEWLHQTSGPLLFEGITTRAVQKRITALGQAAGVADLTPHRLRHTCAKRMIDGGAQLTAVQRVLGHAKIETTARYAMAGWEDLEAAVDGIALGKLKKGA